MNNWHLDKRISITQIITLLTLAVGGVLAYSDMKTGIEANATNIAELKNFKERTMSEETKTQVMLGEIQTTLKFQKETLVEIKGYLNQQRNR